MITASQHNIDRRFELVASIARNAMVIIALFAISSDTMAYEQAFAKTAVNKIEVRLLPPARLLATGLPGAYFDKSGKLFSRLFDYIRNNEVAMTVPVEGDLNRAEMRFYVGTDSPPTLEESETVKLVDVPARRVASIGGRGSYSESNIDKARVRLEAWMATQTEWTAAGAPYAVFWNGPFTPWFMKRFEVHLPIKSANAD